jgi:hypothetical protein
MRPLIALAIVALLALPVLAIASSTRAEDVDIGAFVEFPLEKGDYSTDDGIVINVTLTNYGTTDANLTGSAQLEVKTRLTGDLVWKPLSRSFKDVPMGGEITLLWSKWSPSKGGDFQAKVYVTYFGDTYVKNNEAVRNFSMHSENWIDDPRLEDGKVLPVYGDTGTTFTYSVVYTYNKLPDIVKVMIDGTDHTMQEEDPLDVIAEDGKKYVYLTKLSIGDHGYNFTARYGDFVAKYTDYYQDPQDPKRSLERPFRGPWVNITLNTEVMSPLEGYVTTDFRFSVFYGSAKNLPPDEIVAVINNVTYDMAQSSNSAIYYTGRIEFFVRVLGFDLLMPPVNLTFKCRQGGDSLSLGPFHFKGPSTEMGTLTGNVTDQDGSPIEGAVVTIDPGIGQAITGPDGSYSIQSYEGFGYRVSCSAQGLMSKTYSNVDIAPMTDKKLDIILYPPPIGAILSGYVLTDINGNRTPLGGIRVSLAGDTYVNSTITNGSGGFKMGFIPGGEGYALSVSEDPYTPFMAIFNIQENQIIHKEIVLTEREAAVSILPLPGDVPLDVVFNLTFDSPVNISTVDISLDPPVTTARVLSTDMTYLRVIPQEGLWFAMNYTLTLYSGVRNTSGNLIVWKPLSWTYRTHLQSPGSVQTDPAPDSIDVPLNPQISFTFTIGIVENTLDISLVRSDNRSDLLSMNKTVTLYRNETDHYRSWAVLDVTCGPLDYGKDYIMTISDGLLDIYGRAVFDSPYNLEFTTIDEPDADEDGYPDSVDEFPNDPLYHSDRDDDGFADEIDAFPDDKNEHLDTDGDDIGDGSDPDDDGDGMPDEWESQYGLDPLDPQDAFDDPDGDGYNNVDEYNAGTAPNDRSDHPKEKVGTLWIWIALALVALLIFVAIAFVARFRTKEHPAEE